MLPQETPTSRITLRPYQPEDLPTFFEQQLDTLANHMAAFTSANPGDRAAFDTKWKKITADPVIQLRTIVADGAVAGYISVHTWFGEPELCYWLGHDFWGRGIASQALQEFLPLILARPLFARVAKDNLASLRVLQKNGFSIQGEDREFSNNRNQEIEEWVLVLNT